MLSLCDGFYCLVEVSAHSDLSYVYIAIVIAMPARSFFLVSFPPAAN